MIDLILTHTKNKHCTFFEFLLANPAGASKTFFFLINSVAACCAVDKPVLSFFFFLFCFVIKINK